MVHSSRLPAVSHPHVQGGLQTHPWDKTCHKLHIALATEGTKIISDDFINEDLAQQLIKHS